MCQFQFQPYLCLIAPLASFFISMVGFYLLTPPAPTPLCMTNLKPAMICSNLLNKLAVKKILSEFLVFLHDHETLRERQLHFGV